MIDITFRVDPKNPPEAKAPAGAKEAQQLLEAGNAKFVALDPSDEGASQELIAMSPMALGFSSEPGKPIPQTPFAVILGCADARVPVEWIFHRAVNDIFVVRVAGNVLGNECLGSVEYAVTHLKSVQFLGVLGHSGCGAVTATVDAFLEPSLAPTQGLRSILGAIYASVQGAALALARAHGADVSNAPGYRNALIETAVVFNAAAQAATLRAEVGRDVSFGVYDLLSRRVHVPRAGVEDDTGLLAAPDSFEKLRELSPEVARSDYVTKILNAAS